ncbi:phospholipid/cholesterol/gamma-HCH transport system substrate-binding protein [Muriicola jejuensis]|uniref:MCE family protein n=1 Tax=Muriicola jejuensis TaxID=504488 RepID=A0A6P0UE62_9FLAO|nr:MlaD family protein [Muriicola jejuensis]NER11561.1 MCE family protein [Muriicola jejuensis]SMP19688.1 phospholipid/cholesterol/gamma-HCH transport system substrate-binding protein [Muriicola jejuensis]
MKLSREIKTGIIVIGGILLFILGFSYLKSSPLFDDSKIFYAVYDNVGGLQTGTQVSINGFSVGKVNDIQFKDNSGKLVVTFSVASSFEFSKNSKAELYDTGIIGGKGIQIIPVFDDAPLARSGDTLVTSTRPGLTELVQQKLTPLQLKVEGAVSNADTLLMNFNDVLDDQTKKNLRESIRGLTAVLESFQQSAGTLNEMLNKNKMHIDSSMGNIDRLTSNFAKVSDSLVAANLGETVRNLEATMKNLNGILSKIEKGEGTMGKLMQDEALYNNLTEASRELDLLLQDFRLNPKRYVNVSVFGKKQIDYSLPENDPALINKQ